jgi:N12 class adenine-specific DNA methylase/superfamily II DNA/RNA helicase
MNAIEPTTMEVKVVNTPTTFYFPTDVNLFLGPAKRKADTNLAVIELVKEIEKEGRFATPDEQDLISHYVGYGDSSVLSARYSDVVEAVTNEEFAALRASTLNAHYTSLPIIRGIWAGFLRMGVGKLSVLRVLDPSAGIGHFQSASPECVRTIARWVEIELDKLTAQILKNLHPNIEGKNVVFNDAFENVRLLENQFDLVISNVPFGNYPVVDRNIKESGLKKNIHDYFFVKALSLVKPGGIIAFITSRFTLDKKNSSIREYLARRAELLAAVRLPDTAFVANAGTQVVTDIIILRKRPQMLEGQDLPSWVNTYMVDGAREYQYETEDDTVDRLRENCIYYEHPEWIVGQRSTKRGMYTRDEYTIKYDGEKEIGEVVAEILAKALPEDAMLEGLAAVSKEMDAVVEIVPPAHVIEIKPNLPVDHVRRLEGLRSIYDAARRLLDLETKGVTGLPVTIQRDTLNKVYDTFVMRYGPITNKLHQRLLETSPALPFLLALENDYSPLTNSAQKALIFTESTVRSAPSTEGIQNCTDALLYCLNQSGTVDIDMIADLARVTVDEALTELGDRVLWTPEGGLALSDVYLSGNIAEKLEKARALATIEPKLKVTVDALVNAMPKPLKPGQIKARLGSGWIPARYVAQFIEELLPGITMQVTYIPKLGTWTVTHKKGYMPAENSSKYGTKRYTGLELIEAGLNAHTPVVYDTVEDEQGNEKRVLNQQETIAAQAKLEELKTRFDTWLWSDDARAEHLAELYNARFNVFVRPHSDGSHLTLPGLSKLLIPRPLQKDAVWFSLQRAATLVGDEVGLGKTLTAIIAVMEAIRLGSAHKSLLVVPNHLTEQWRDAFLLAYPNANVLCAGKDDLSKSKRWQFMSRIATGRWDAVIVPQSSFKMLPVKPETLNKFVEEELEELRDFLQRIKAEKEVDNRARKQIEKAIKRFEAKLINKSEMDKDSTDTITWDEMGIDMLVSDEFHAYKNLYCHTKMTRIAGLPNTDSQRAFDMFVKVRDLMQRGGRFMGLTGTPISNTMAETFTLQRYFSYDQLVEMGLSHFDSWAQMFADVVMMPEMTPDGSGFRVNTRLARFSNIPELSAMLSQFMILRRFKDVNGQVDRPHLYCDKPTAVKIPGSRQLKEYVKLLAKRAEDVRGGQVDPRDDNMLKIVGDGRKAALDLRLAIPGMADIPLSKINISTQSIAAIYHHTSERKSAQIVFCDLGTPKPHKDSVVLKDSDENENATVQETDEEVVFFKNVYADIKAKLVKLGVHPADIAFIHDAKGPAERSQLFAAVREGRIRVLIGSTEKMGTGMNAQTRALAMHHLDAPWRPADLEQREGRLIRQGNMYPEVFSFVYIVEGSFDSYVWQILETKAKFIEQFLTGQTDVREMDDIGETVLSMAEIKALASGNPKIMERVMAQNEIMKLEQLRLSWQNERRNSQRQLSSRKEELEQTNIRIRNLGIGAQMRDGHTSDPFTMKVDGKEYTERKLAGQQLIEMGRAVKLDAERTGKETRKAAGSYRGFVMWLRAKPNSERNMSDLVQDPNGGMDIILDYNVPQVLVAHVSDSDAGTVASVDAAIRSIDSEIKKSTERRDFLMREIDTLKTLLKDPWEKAEKLEALVARLTELDQELIKAGIDLRKDEAKEQGENGVEEIHVEKEEVPEPEQVLEFDINAILRRIDEIHGTMTLPVYAEEELIAVPSVLPDAIPVTQESIAQLECQAESAALMAGFTRSILSGTGQMSIDDFLEMNVTQVAPRKGISKAQKKVENGQLTLF